MLKVVIVGICAFLAGVGFAKMPLLMLGEDPMMRFARGVVSDGDEQKISVGEVRELRTAGIRFCWCPPDGHGHEAFWLGQTEVTQLQWERLMHTKPWTGRVADQHDYPVSYVSWDDAMEFCRLLTDRSWADGSLRQEWRCTLPTTSEWEYAYRAGTTTERFFDLVSGESAGVSQYYGLLTASFPTRAGRRLPNGWGFHDIAGSAIEWCDTIDRGEDETDKPSRGINLSVGVADYNHRQTRSAAMGFRVAIIRDKR